MKLRDIFLHFPESFAEPVANIVLRCPLDEWPAFVVKMSLLEKIKGIGSIRRPCRRADDHFRPEAAA